MGIIKRWWSARPLVRIELAISIFHWQLYAHKSVRDGEYVFWGCAGPLSAEIRICKRTEVTADADDMEWAKREARRIIGMTGGLK